MQYLKSVAAIAVGAMLAPGPAVSQTIALYVDTPEGYVSAYDVIIGESGHQFDLVTVVDSGGHDIGALEWIQTPLTPPDTPGVFKLASASLICPSCHHLGNRSLGEFLFGAQYCGDREFVVEASRITYLILDDVLGDDLVLGLRGFQEGDTRPSSFDGLPGFVDCADNKYPLAVAGGPALVTGSGVVVPSGHVVINPTPNVVVGSDGHSFGHLKAVFR